MNMKQRQAALAKLSPVSVDTTTTKRNSDPLFVQAGMLLGAAPVVVTKNVRTFWSAIKVGYQCAEHDIK